MVTVMRDWRPGDPIHPRPGPAGLNELYDFRDDADDQLSDDAACWPEPHPLDALPDRDELGTFIAEYRRVHEIPLAG